MLAKCIEKMIPYVGRQMHWYLTTVKICVDISFFKNCFSFQIFFVVYRFHIKSFFHILLYFTSNLSSFFKKDFYLVSSKSLQYALILGSIMHHGLTVLPSLQKWILQSFPLTEAIATLIKLIAFCIIMTAITYFKLKFVSYLKRKYK